MKRRSLYAAICVVAQAATALVLYFMSDPEPAFAPTIDVPVDYSEVEQWQRVSDQGHMPWRMNPLSVTGVFLRQLPEEINFTEHDLTLTLVDEGAIIQVAIGPVHRVYLQRAYPEKEGSIWVVVGYDPRH